jgi:hypothetical protein
MFNGGIPVATACPAMHRMRLRPEIIPAGFDSDTAMSLKNYEDSSGSVSVVFDLPSRTGSVLLGRIL